jgi:F-type H+-transporting ATPase subunit alpha
MRTVAGRLRIDLAQFRALEAFASFASDLVAATKRQLERGARTVEVLKQGQYQPMPVEQQVMIIYAVTNGYLDDVQVNAIREWERGFHEFVAAQFPQVGERLRAEKVLSKEIEADLKRAIDEYKKTAASGRPAFTAASR